MQLLFVKVLLGIVILGVAGGIIWKGYVFKKPPVSSVSQSSVAPQDNLEGASTNEETTKENVSNSFIENLRKRQFEGGAITIEKTFPKEGNYTTYTFSYPSDNLKIYGMMNVPEGNGPFPVIVLNHGYFNSSTFKSGDGTHTMADILASKGYLTLASDYRGFGKSEDTQGQRAGGHRPEYAIDVLNLIASIKNVPKADTNRIGMWGHSMGGEVSLRAAEATEALKAIVLWAPTSANASDNANFYGRRSSTNANASENEGISPINYLTYISAPISLHQGLADSEVKPEWSRALNNALKKEGKSIEYFEYPGQDHNFRNLGWDLISERTVAFYDTYLKK